MPSPHPQTPVVADHKYLVDINKDNLARVITFVNIYDGKAKFVLTVILAVSG